MCINMVLIMIICSGPDKRCEDLCLCILVYSIPSEASNANDTLMTKGKRNGFLYATSENQPLRVCLGVALP